MATLGGFTVRVRVPGVRLAIVLDRRTAVDEGALRTLVTRDRHDAPSGRVAGLVELVDGDSGYRVVVDRNAMPRTECPAQWGAGVGVVGGCVA